MKALVFGHLGAFGSWIMEYLTNRSTPNGTHVSGIDLRQRKTLADQARQIRNSDLIVNTASLSASSGIARLVAVAARPDTLFVDLASSKKEIAPIMESAHCDYVLIHPMSAPPKIGMTLDEKTTVYIIREKITQDRTRELFTMFRQGYGGTGVHMPLEQHNLNEEINQVVPHRLLMGFASAIIASGMTIDEVEAGATPIGKLLITALRRHFSLGNSDTVAELQRLADKGLRSPYTAFSNSIRQNEWLCAIRRPDLIKDGWRHSKKELGL